jgi:hypothetical protein
MMLTSEQVAQVVHGAHCALNAVLGDPAPDGPWETLTPEHKEQVTRRVRLIREGCGPEAIHQAWVSEMTALGWVPGDVKDPCAVPRTHPCLRPWRELPPDQQRKDTQAIAITRNLLGDGGLG